MSDFVDLDLLVMWIWTGLFDVGIPCRLTFISSMPNVSLTNEIILVNDSTFRFIVPVSVNSSTLSDVSSNTPHALLSFIRVHLTFF